MQQPPRLLVASARAPLVAQLRTALADYELRVVPDVEAVLIRTRSAQPDLLVLDLELPGAKGDLLRVLDACGRGALPVFALGPSLAANLDALRAGASDAVREDFDEEELRTRLEVLLRQRVAADDLRSRAGELERLSVTDSLTGLGNRRQFDGRLRDEFRRAQRYRDPLSLLLVDLDHFKAVNDRHGHLFGDEILRGVSDALGASVRGIDIVCRYGGEEFGVLLPRTPLSGSFAVARRVAEAIAAVRVPTAAEVLRVTASVGVAAVPGEDIHAEHDLVRAADSALYQAKRSGRNRVCAYPSVEVFFPPPPPPGVPARA